MLEGMYAAAAGMIAQQARLDALSSDIANVNTAGYKPIRQGFRDLLYSEAGIATQPGVQLGAGSSVVDLGRNTAQGTIHLTENPLDIAVSGPGYFTVRSADGETFLTRGGHLQLDARGRLSTQTGYLLQPTITVPAGTQPSEIAIAANGDVAVGTQVVGRIRLVTVPAQQGLLSRGDDLFVATAASGQPRAAGTGTTVIQGSIEDSAADLSDAMVGMIQAQRAYELASRAISTQDRIAEIANGVKR